MGPKKEGRKTEDICLCNLVSVTSHTTIVGTHHGHSIVFPALMCSLLHLASFLCLSVLLLLFFVRSLDIFPSLPWSCFLSSLLRLASSCSRLFASQKTTTSAALPEAALQSAVAALEFVGQETMSVPPRKISTVEVEML